MTDHQRALPKPEGSYSATQWRHFYFYGFASRRPSDIELTAGMIQSLLSTVGVPCAIATRTAFDPRLVINSKGTTVWIELFVFALATDSEGVKAVATGGSRLIAPPGHGRETFSGHVNWPEQMLRSNPMELKQGHLFIIPFLVDRSAASPTQLKTSLKSQDDQLEVLGLAEFHDDTPQTFLEHLSAVASNLNK